MSFYEWSRGTRLGQNVKMLSNPFLPLSPCPLSRPPKEVSLGLFRKSSIPNHPPEFDSILSGGSRTQMEHASKAKGDLPSSVYACNQILRLIQRKRGGEERRGVRHKVSLLKDKQIIVFPSFPSGRPLVPPLPSPTISAILRLHSLLLLLLLLPTFFLPAVLEYRISLPSQRGEGGREGGSEAHLKVAITATAAVAAAAP